MAIIYRALEGGINFIDTANAYGNSEERIGRAIAGRREGLILATKSHAREGSELRQHLELSLKQLGVDYIDLYQLHKEEAFDLLEPITSRLGIRLYLMDELEAMKEVRAALGRFMR